MLVTVQNFQAIREASLCIDGFTAVVGRSNIGKSAVVRALKCALTAAEGTDFVRHDPEACSRLLKGNQKCACFASVKIQFNSGDTVLWEKGDTVNRYTVVENGVKQEYSRVGKNPEMPALLKGFEEIQIGSNPKELVQVSDQFHPIFLLNASGPATADLLSDVAQLDDINKAMALVTRDRKKDSSVRSVRETDIKVLETDLKAYVKLDNTLTQMQGVDSGYTTIRAAGLRLESLSGFILRARGIKEAILGLNTALSPTLPGISPLSRHSKQWVSVSGWLVSYEAGTEAIQTLQRAVGPEIPKGDLKSLSAGYQRVIRYSALFQEKTETISKLDGVGGVAVPVLSQISDRAEKLTKLTAILRSLQLLKVVLTKYQGLEGVAMPASPDLSKKLVKLKSVGSCLIQYERLTKGIEDFTKDLDAASEEEEKVLEAFADLGVCPSCSQPLRPGVPLCKVS